MTYIVSSGTLNPTILYHTVAALHVVMTLTRHVTTHHQYLLLVSRYSAIVYIMTDTLRHCRFSIYSHCYYLAIC